MSQAPHVMHLRDGTKMGDAEDDRHHDQGRPVGCLQRLPHGHDRRERRAAVADHAATSRTSSRSPRRTRPRPPRRPASSRTRSRRSRSRRRKGDVVVADDEYIKDGVTLESVAQAAPGLRQGRHGHGRQRLRHQRRRRRRRADDARRSQEARHQAARAHRVVGAAPASIPSIMGTGPIPASKKALEKAGWTVAGSRPRSRPTRRSPRRPAPSTRASAGIRRRSTSTAAPSPSAIRSARRARAC